MAAVKGAVLFNLQTARRAPLIFSSGIVLSLALGALKLNDFSGHGFLQRAKVFFSRKKQDKAKKPWLRGRIKGCSPAKSALEYL
jgi:hypothetical protein